MESNTYRRSVRPVLPPVAYIGGKRKLAPEIVPWIDSAPHRCYAEPFIGMGGLFFSRRQAPRVEVINDISREVITFFRVLQVHYTHLMETIRFNITSRAEFERLVETPPETLTDIYRAARFMYLQACAFGGKASGRNFGVSRDSFHGFSIGRLGPILEAVHERLSEVVIECLPALELIARYDGDDTLFYLDPPYFGSETDYGKGVWDREDFDRLAEILAGIRGRFLLSINDTPEIRRIFGAFSFVELQTTYTIARDGTSQVRELLFRGPAARDWSLREVQGELL